MLQRNVPRTWCVSLSMVGFLLGLVMARRIEFGMIWCVVALSMIPLFRKGKILSMLSISMVGVLFGGVRGTIMMHELRPYGQYAQHPVIVEGYALSDAVYGNRKQLQFDVGNIVLKYGQSSHRLPGSIAVGGFGVPMVFRGDTVVVRGKLQLARGSRQARISFARLQIAGSKQSWSAVVSRRFASAVQSALPEPHGSLLMGLLVGQRSTLPKQLTDELSIVGLTHIVAVSGYNVTILVQLARRLLERFSKYQATVLMVAMILGFVTLCGASATIVRATIVSLLSLWAWYYGRTVKPIVLILLTAAITAGWFPPYLWSDIGWHLSFLAFWGILVVAPAIYARFRRLGAFGPITQLFIETFSAQLVTAPLILFVFGRLSLIALVVNLLVLPLIPVAMLTGLVAGMAGWLLPSFAGWVAWPAKIFAIYMLDIISRAAKIPMAATEIQLTAWQMSVCYMFILILVIVWRRGRQNGKIQIRNSRSR